MRQWGAVFGVAELSGVPGEVYRFGVGTAPWVYGRNMEHCEQEFSLRRDPHHCKMKAEAVPR